MFPSPLGEVGSLIETVKPIKHFTKVSVPSRGSGFLNDRDKNLSWVSLLFPSPLGEVGSLIAYLVAIKNDLLHLVFSR